MFTFSEKRQQFISKAEYRTKWMWWFGSVLKCWQPTGPVLLLFIQYKSITFMLSLSIIISMQCPSITALSATYNMVLMPTKGIINRCITVHDYCWLWKKPFRTTGIISSFSAFQPCTITNQSCYSLQNVTNFTCWPPAPGLLVH